MGPWVAIGEKRGCRRGPLIRARQKGTMKPPCGDDRASTRTGSRFFFSSFFSGWGFPYNSLKTKKGYPFVFLGYSRVQLEFLPFGP